MVVPARSVRDAPSPVAGRYAPRGRDERLRIAVVVDGAGTAAPAIRLASELASRSGTRLHVIAPLPPVATDGTALAAARLEAAGGVPPAVGYSVVHGNGRPAATIERMVRVVDAGMVVLAIGERRTAERAIAGETAIQTSRLLDVPILAVPAGSHRLPGRPLVVFDRARPGTRAIDAVLRTIDPPGDVILAVIEREGSAEELLRLARVHRADLIAVEVPGASLLDRILSGRIPSRILVDADRPVLLVPGARDAGPRTRHPAPGR